MIHKATEAWLEFQSDRFGQERQSPPDSELITLWAMGRLTVSGIAATDMK